MAEIRREIAAYDRLRDALEADHLGEWVVVHDEELVGTYQSFEIAARKAVKCFGQGPYLIRQIGAPRDPLMILSQYANFNAVG